MRILFLCNTLYQLIVACCVTKTFFFEDCVDVILSDHTNGTKEIADRINDKKVLFNEAYWVKTKYLYDETGKLGRKGYVDYLKNDDATNFKTEKTYDKLLIANSEPFSNWLFNYLKRKNKRLSLEWFEDGIIGTCFTDAEFLATKSNLKEDVKGMIKKLCKVYDVPTNVEKIYLSEPDLFKQPIKAKKIGIKENCIFEESLKDCLNIIFDYKSCIDKYDEKYIFFEDGFCEWDEQLKVLNEYAVNLNKDDLIVKRHPRDAEDIFGKTGYRTNKNTNVPWEVIALNIDLNNKVLMTLYSQSTIMPGFLLGKKCKSIILTPLYKKFNPNETCYKRLYENFYSKDANCTIVERN